MTVIISSHFTLSIMEFTKVCEEVVCGQVVCVDKLCVDSCV